MRLFGQISVFKGIFFGLLYAAAFAFVFDSAIRQTLVACDLTERRLLFWVLPAVVFILCIGTLLAVPGLRLTIVYAVAVVCLGAVFFSTVYRMQMDIVRITHPVDLAQWRAARMELPFTAHLVPDRSETVIEFAPGADHRAAVEAVVSKLKSESAAK